MNRVKKFKDWDKMFTERQKMLCREHHLRISNGVPTAWRWPVDVWPQEKVQFAVYKAPDAIEWQLFRVSMKGLDTHEKLAMLYRYYALNFEEQPLAKQDIEKCRIDNYILALRRGGQLNEKYEVNK